MNLNGQMYNIRLILTLNPNYNLVKPLAVTLNQRDLTWPATHHLTRSHPI